MPKWLKIGTSFLLVLSTLFVWIGYAALTDELTITGELDFEVPEEVVITETELYASGNGVTSDQTFIWPTNVDSSVTTTGAGNTATYRIKVKNNSVNTTYSYARIAYDNTVYDNGQYENKNIQIKITTDAAGRTTATSSNTKLEPGQSMELYSTYTFPAGSSATYHTLLNYKFLPHLDAVEAGEIAVNKTMAHFEGILNNPETLQRLETLMAGNKDNSDTGGYIGNVAGADEGDSGLVNELFTDENGNNILTLESVGLTTNITCLIKEEIVNNRNCMTLYLTPDEISGWTGRVAVYANVFYQDDKGTWNSFGDLYEGTASKNNYEGSFFGTRNSFNTDTWESKAQSFTVCEGYTYNGTVYNGLTYSITAEKTIDEVIAATNESVASYLAQILAHAEEIHADVSVDFAGAAVDNLALAIANAKITGADPVSSIKELHSAIQPFL